jgi:hypothetical protein
MTGSLLDQTFLSAPVTLLVLANSVLVIDECDSCVI